MEEVSVRIADLIAPVFLPVHWDVREKAHSEYWLMGGRGSTKSSFVSLEIVLGLMRTPGANAIVYRKVAATLRESVYEQIWTAIEWLGVSEFFSCRVSPMEIRYKPTDQRILFRGADDPSKSKSIKLSKGYFGFLWFEELSEFQGMNAVRMIQASVIRGGGRTITFYTYNPPVSAKDWVNVEAVRPVEARLVHASSYLDVPPEWLGADFIAQAEALRLSNERGYRHMYLGEVTGSGGQVFDNLELRRIDDQELAKLDRFYNGLDFGFAVDPDAFTRWAYDRRGRVLYAVDEFYGAHNSTDRLGAEVLARAGCEAVRCDSADPRMIAELTGRGVRAMGVKKGPGSVEHGVRWLQNMGKIVIDPERTPNIAREFRGYEYAQDRDGGFLAEYPDRDNHAIDSARYALEPEIGRRVATTRKDIYLV